MSRTRPSRIVIRTIICENCGKEKRFTGVQYARGTHKPPRFCDQKCYWEYQRKNAKIITKICPVCQKSFTTRQTQQVYCSHACWRIGHLKKLVEMTGRSCTHCGKELIPTINWSLNHCRACTYICNSCYAPLQKAYAKKYNEKRRDTVLQTHLESNSKKRWYHVKKRPYTKTCELCGRLPSYKSLPYHHWNDETPEKGIWVCSSCHMFVNMYDKMQKSPELVSKYLALKESIQLERNSDFNQSTSL